MKKLTATLCLTIAVLLGLTGVSWSADFEKSLRVLYEDLTPDQRLIIKSLPLRRIEYPQPAGTKYQGIFIDKVCGDHVYGTGGILELDDGEMCFSLKNGEYGFGCLERRIYPGGSGNVLRYGPWVGRNGELRFFDNGGFEVIPTNKEIFALFVCASSNAEITRLFQNAKTEFLRLAKEEDADAMYRLGWLDQFLRRKFSRAAEWYEKSMYLGNKNSKEALSMMCNDANGDKNGNFRWGSFADYPGRTELYADVKRVLRHCNFAEKSD